jgi:hypothetical protein
MRFRALVFLGVAALVFTAFVVGVLAQAAPDNPKFEVASVKPNISGSARFVGFLPCQFRTTNMTLRTLQTLG